MAKESEYAKLVRDTCMEAAGETGLSPSDVEVLGKRCARVILDETADGGFHGWWKPTPDQIREWLDENRRALRDGGGPVRLMDFAYESGFDVTGETFRGVLRSMRGAFPEDNLREHVADVLGACVDAGVVTANVSPDNSVSYFFCLDLPHITVPVEGNVDDIWDFIREGTTFLPGDTVRMPGGKEGLRKALPIDLSPHGGPEIARIEDQPGPFRVAGSSGAPLPDFRKFPPLSLADRAKEKPVPGMRQ